MNQTKNQQEIRLLNDDPNALIEKYQYIIGATVARFIQRGFFDRFEKEEIVQELNLQLLEGKMERIRSNYNGSVFLATYFSKVIYNSCLEMIRSRRRKPRVVSDEVLEFHISKEPGAEKAMLIADELMRLEAILKGFQRRKEKLLLCLKLYARKPLGLNDLLVFPDSLLTRMNLNQLLNRFGADYEMLNDKEVHQFMVPYFNEMENKNANADSLRKWLNMQLDKMIFLLNGEPPVSNYERNTLRILLDLYFNRKKSG